MRARKYYVAAPEQPRVTFLATHNIFEPGGGSTGNYLPIPTQLSRAYIYILRCARPLIEPLCILVRRNHGVGCGELCQARIHAINPDTTTVANSRIVGSILSHWWALT